jgi:transcriptional adapter 2-alpha
MDEAIGSIQSLSKESKKDKSEKEKEKDKDKERETKSKRTGAAGEESKTPRKPPQPLNLAKAPSLHLLTSAEMQLCSALRILPQPFLLIKSTLISTFVARGGKLSRRECRALVKIDVNKLGKVWDFFNEMGYFDAAREAGWNGGVGSPPGHHERHVKKPDWLGNPIALTASYSFAPATPSGNNQAHGGAPGDGEDDANDSAALSRRNGSLGVAKPASSNRTPDDSSCADLTTIHPPQRAGGVAYHARGSPMLPHATMNSGRAGSQSPRKADKYRPTAAV